MNAPSRVGVILCAVVAGIPAGGAAQAPAECREVLIARGVDANRISRDPCQDLAVMIQALAPSVTRAANEILREDAVPVGSVFSQRDLQARHPQQASLAGTGAQGQAIPSVQPAGVAAGSIARLGTDAGSESLAALGLNPAILFLGDEVSKLLAQYTRFADVSVLVPLSSLRDDDPAGTDDPDYIGARVRLNFTGLSSGSRVWEGARTLVRNWIARGGRNVERIRLALAEAPSVGECVTALLDRSENAAAINAGCGAPLSLEVDMQEAAQLRAELTRVRQAADARYFGADLRFDDGDPTLGAVADASGQFMYAGLAFGRRLGATTDGAARGIRTRLGVRHGKLDVAGTSEFAAEGGLGFDVARTIEEQELSLSGAIEFRTGNAPANLTDQFQTNFVALRGSFLMPLFAGNSVSINFALPIDGDVTRSLSVNLNWGLLLPGAVR